MLEVMTTEEATRIIAERFGGVRTDAKRVLLAEALGRTLAEAACSPECLPPFDRSTVDGYAVRAADTFGCSDAIPAVLAARTPVAMGEEPRDACEPYACVPVPTGAKLPEGADAVVMVERTEDYGDGTIGIAKPVAPGENVVFAGDELAPGATIAPAGTVLKARHLGALAAVGITEVAVQAPVRVGVISTGDEIVPFNETPTAARMRDVNGPLLTAAVREAGGEAVDFGIVPDERDTLAHAVDAARAACDLVLVTGGSSVGERDNTARVFAACGELLFHGIAMKPGKPTLCADADGTPLIGLPGHPAAAYFVFLEFVRPLIERMAGRDPRASVRTVEATLTATIPANHGRSECVAVKLEHAPAEDDAPAQTLPCAHPVRAKSGLIALLREAHGYLTVERDCEGLPAGQRVTVKLF